MNMDHNAGVEMLSRGDVLDPALRLGWLQEPANV